MIFGAHILFYSTNPEADRAFLRDALGLRFVDSGGGWLIFALPPAEAGVHPSDGAFTQEHAGRRMLGSILYLMCDDLADAIRAARRQRAAPSRVAQSLNLCCALAVKRSPGSPAASSLAFSFAPLSLQPSFGRR